MGVEPTKRYLLLVKGRWMDPVRNVKLPLLKYLLESGERRVRVSDEGKISHTIFRLIARWEQFSLLEAELRSRAHTPDSCALRTPWLSDCRRTINMAISP